VDWERVLDDEQLARLLAKSMRESRKNCKRYLHDQGVVGGAEALDELLAVANARPAVIARASEIDKVRMSLANASSSDLDSTYDAMRSEVRAAMHRADMSIDDVAIASRLTSDLVSRILSGATVPTTEQLARLSIALRSQWRLE
jgi:hypothetical protein